MERVVLKAPKANPSFIGSWIIDPISLCDDLINHFERNVSRQRMGITSGGQNLNIKDRLDISIHPKQLNEPGNEVFGIYMSSLFLCYKDYLTQWSTLRGIGERLEVGMFNLGRYNPGQHFQGIHSERSGLDTLHRVLAWMTYLNDVEDGGETYFINYDLNIRPQKGLTIIWPADWTHAHKGNIVLDGSKYMITGWMNFPE